MDRIYDLLRHLRQHIPLIALSLVSMAAASQEPSNGTDEPVSSAASGFGGSSSVGAQIDADAQPKETMWRFAGMTGLLQPYYNFKSDMQSQHGWAFGADYNMMSQRASESLGLERAGSGALRLYSTWTLYQNDDGDSGSIVAKIENRHKLWADIPTQSLGGEIGYAGLTSVPFSDAGTVLTNLYWHQSFKADTVAFIAGVIDPTDYIDVYGLVNPWTDFSNLSFTTNPTIPVPNQGPGAAVRLDVREQYYLIAGFADSNANPAAPVDSLQDFVDDLELFKHVEFGWVSSRDNQFTDNVHVTLWQVDERPRAGVGSGWGGTFSFSYRFSEHWLPFLRVGISDGGGGAFLDRSLAGGIGYFRTARSDHMGIGVAWGRPAEETLGPGLDDQWSIEGFYRLQLFQHTSVSASIQLLVDPALNPSADRVFVWGLGARMAF